MSELRDLALATDEREALAQVLDRVTSAVEDALGAADAPEPARAVALVYGDGQDELEPAAVHLALETDTTDELGETWNVNSWQGPELSLDPWPGDDEAFAAANALLFEALDRHGVNPVRWVLARVARRLAGQELPIATVPGFVVLPLDQAAPEQVAEDMAFVSNREGMARPASAASSVAYLQELLDEDELRWLAVFECHVESALDGETEEDEGPAAAPLADALTWADGVADRIRVTVGETDYTAGRVRLAGLPAWERSRTVVPRSLT